VSLNWSVPGVREWLMGTSSAAAAAAAHDSRHHLPDVAVSAWGQQPEWHSCFYD
jgi:hypothetical protein